MRRGVRETFDRSLPNIVLHGGVRQDFLAASTVRRAVSPRALARGAAPAQFTTLLAPGFELQAFAE